MGRRKEEVVLWTDLHKFISDSKDLCKKQILHTDRSSKER